MTFSHFLLVVKLCALVGCYLLKRMAGKMATKGHYAARLNAKHQLGSDMNHLVWLIFLLRSFLSASYWPQVSKDIT